MKALVTLLLLVTVACASITLTSSLTIRQGVTVVESNPQGAAMLITSDYQVANPSLVIVMQAGNVNGVSLTPGTVAAGNIQISVDVSSGHWTASNGQSGTLSAPALANLQTTLKTLRNTAETFALNNNIVSGTQVPW